MYLSKNITRIISLVLCFILILPISAFAQQSTNDYSKHWAGEQIKSFLDKGFITVDKDGNFKPDNPITRGDFAAIANKAFNFTEKDETNFKDVKSSDNYYNDISIAKKAGYFVGLPDGTVLPKGYMSRQEFALIISRLLKLDITKYITESSNFKDAAAIPNWSKGAIGAVAKVGYMRGEPGNMFNPKGTVTRAQAVAVLERCYLSGGSLHNNTNVSEGAMPTIIFTSSTVANGAVNPDIVVTLINDTFTANGISNLTANWMSSIGTTGLAGSTITRDSDTQITFHLTGTAQVGTITLKAKEAALTSGVESNTITIFVLAASEAKGTIEPVVSINGMENTASETIDHSITFKGEIAYYIAGESNNLPISANWVGVKMTAPEGVTPDENAVFYVNGRNCNMDEISGWNNIIEEGDGINYFHLYQRITDISRDYIIAIKWNDELTETYSIDFASSATLEVLRTDLENMINGAQFNYDNGANYGSITYEAINTLGTAIDKAQAVYDGAVQAKTEATQLGIYAAHDELISAMEAFFDSYETEIEALSQNMAINTTYDDENPLILSLSIKNGIGDFVTPNTDYITFGGDLSKMVIKSVKFEGNPANKVILELIGSIGDSTDNGTITIAAGGVNGHKHGFEAVAH